MPESRPSIKVFDGEPAKGHKQTNHSFHRQEKFIIMSLLMLDHTCQSFKYMAIS